LIGVRLKRRAKTRGKLSIGVGERPHQDYLRNRFGVRAIAKAAWLARLRREHRFV